MMTDLDFFFLVALGVTLVVQGGIRLLRWSRNYWGVMPKGWETPDRMRVQVARLEEVAELRAEQVVQ